MSLFNFGNLIQKENVPTGSISAVANSPKTLSRDPHSLKRLVEQAVKEKKAQQPELKPVMVPELPPATVEEKNIVPETKQITISAETVPERLAVLEKSETPENVFENNDKLAENQTYGTFFLKTMLSEFSDALEAGKLLHELELRKASNKDERIGTEAEFQNTRSDAKTKFRESIVNLLGKDEITLDEIRVATNEYENYLKDLENTYRSSMGILTEEETEFTKKITEKKRQLPELMEKVGSQTVFAEIKKVVTFCKEQRIKEIKKAQESVKPETIKTISQNVADFVENDSVGAQMLTESGNIIGILMRVFQKPDDLETQIKK